MLYSYEQIDVPSGVVLLDASAIFAKTDVFLYTEGASAGSPSAFSNLFRYELLRRYGDWWCDTDVICLSDRMPEQTLVFAYQDCEYINGAVLKIVQGHNFAQQLQSEAKMLGKNVRWGQAGPHLITRLVRLNKLEQFAVPTELVYPIHWRGALDFLLPDRTGEVLERVKGSIFVHLWNEILRRASIIKEVAPPADSFLHEQFRRYGVTFSSGIRYSAYQIQRIVDTTRDLDFAISQRDQLQDELQRRNSEVTLLQDELQRRNSEVTLLQDELQSREEKAERLRSEKDTISAEAETLRTTVGSVQSEAERLRAMIGAVQSEKNALSAEVEGLRTTLGAVWGSSSWKLTKPVRTVGETLRAMRGKRSS